MVLSGISIGKEGVAVKRESELWVSVIFAEGLALENQRCEDGFIIERMAKEEER